MNIELGMRVKDKITGFKGVAVYKADYIHGCSRFGVQPQELKDCKPIEDQIFDEPQIDILDDGKLVIESIANVQKIEIGKKVEDSVSGFKGIAIGRTVFINGCGRILIGPKVSADNKLKNLWFDEGQVEYVKEISQSESSSVKTDSSRRTGGPCEKPNRDY